MVDHLTDFWLKLSSTAESLDVEEPQLPCCCKAHKTVDDGTSAGDFHSTPKEYYCQHYYQQALSHALLIILTRLAKGSTVKYIMASKQEEFDSYILQIILHGLLQPTTALFTAKHLRCGLQ